jgi:hypothetical protein
MKKRALAVFIYKTIKGRLTLPLYQKKNKKILEGLAE